MADASSQQAASGRSVRGAPKQGKKFELRVATPKVALRGDLGWLRKRAAQDKRGVDASYLRRLRQRADRPAGGKPANILIELVAMPRQFSGTREALKVLGFRSSNKRPGSAARVPLTPVTARAARALAEYILVIDLSDGSAQRSTSETTDLNRVESYDAGLDSEDRVRGEQLTLDDDEYIRIERGLGVTTLAWTTDLPLVEVIERLRVQDLAVAERPMRLKVDEDVRPDIGSSVSTEVNLEAGFKVIQSAHNAILYAVFPCAEFDLLWRKQSQARTAQRAGMAEVAIVYESATARLDEATMRKLGSRSVQFGLSAFTSQSQLFGER